MIHYDVREFQGLHSINPFWPYSPYQPEIYAYYPQVIPQRMNWNRTASLAAAITKERIRHIVLFSLRPEIGGTEAGTFLSQIRQVLASIPGVEHVHVYCQINPQNDYQYGVSMEFANPSLYEAFKIHPTHVKLLEEQWNKKVDRYFIIDFKVC